MLERLRLVQTPPMSTPMIEDCLALVFGFLQRVALILVQHATSGLQTQDEHITTNDSPSVGKLLLGIDPHPVTLPFMSIEG